MARLAPEVGGTHLMHHVRMNEPGPALQHPTGLEGDRSEAPKIREEEYHTKETWQAQAERLAGALYILEGLPPAERTAVAHLVLGMTGAGFPEVPGFGDIREQAELWGDSANHLEIETYLRVLLDRIGGVPLALSQRKRLLVAIWKTLSDDDRRSFLARVDPDGRLQARGA